VKLGLVQKHPSSRAALALVERPVERASELGRGSRVARGGPGPSVKDPTEDLADPVPRDGEQILVGCAASGGIGH
jgi:hypothetical protein